MDHSTEKREAAKFARGFLVALVVSSAFWGVVALCVAAVAR